MSDIRAEMPVLVSHEGDWKGTYTVVDSEGISKSLNLLKNWRSLFLLA